MMKKFSRSKVLGMVTAGAMVVTTAFSFAAWDQLTDKATGGTAKMDKQVTVKATDMAAFGRTAASTEGNAATYAGSTTFTTANIADTTKVQMALTPKVTLSGTDVTSQFEIVVTDAADSNTVLTSAAGVYTDATVQAGANAYSIAITPKADLTQQQITALEDKTVDIEVTGLLSSTTAP